MWKNNSSPVPVSIAAPEPVSPIESPLIEPSIRPRAVAMVQESAVIAKGQTFKGEITGGGSLFVDGRVEGSINIPSERVTVGPNGVVAGSMSALTHHCIVAREIVIMGKVMGDVCASERVEIRNEGTLDGDVSTARISIADGAYFRGGVVIRKIEAKSVPAQQREPVEEAKTA